MPPNAYDVAFFARNEGTLMICRICSARVCTGDLCGMISHFNFTGCKPVWLISLSVLPDLEASCKDNLKNALEWPAGSHLPTMLCGWPIFFSEDYPSKGDTGDVILCDSEIYPLASMNRGGPKVIENVAGWKLGNVVCLI